MNSIFNLNTSKRRILILSAIEIIVILVLDIIMISKISNSQNVSGLSGIAIVFSAISLLVVIVVAFLMIREGEEVNKESTVKSDKYRKLFLNLPIGFAQAEIVVPAGTNVPEYKIVDANERFCEYLSLEAGSYQDKLLCNCKQDVLQSVNAWFRAYDNSGTKEGDLMAVEITMENLDKVFNTVMYKSEANYINMVVIDITEQKETEMSLSKAKDEANIAYKTQAEFLANMSHEIRTPINGILGMLQLTLAEDDLQADYRDNLVTAKNCADTLLRLINDILDISKLEAGKYNLRYEVFDVKSAIEETVAAQVPLANNKDLTLDCSFSGTIPEMVKGDGERIKQVLNCLLSNAIKFTSEGGVRVKVATMDGDEPDKTTLRIAVVDSGIGISDANKSKLFIRFSQVDSSDTRKYGGTGLGLVITKQIVELMGGNISVQSKEDIGSTFIVEIPLKIVKASEQKTEKKEDSAVISISGHKRARILVAEDEPVNQQVIGKLLGMAGYSYDIAENGEKAVELFKQKSYDAALFDVQMPIMDGLAATQLIRNIEEEKNLKRLPIIAVTARAMFGDKERILEAKLDDYIAKPYNLNDVVETLNRYVGQEEK
ncbi:MAG: ATP-binding protein [Bacteroides sp.]|nr:ATP-binding protein [Bacteroides sp.]MCM1549970.1 ATP-binding protein [Clostridium sp.]